MGNTILVFIFLYIFSISNAHSQILVTNSNSNDKQQSIGGEKSGSPRQNTKSAEDFLSDDLDNPRFRRDNPILHYDTPIAAAPLATELDYDDNTIVNEPTASILTTTNLMHTTTFQGLIPNKPIDNPLRDLAPVVNVQQNPIQQTGGDVYEKSTIKFTFVTPGSTYYHLGHGRRPCQHNSDCYEMREPDEWCPSVAHPDQFFERGCFCEHSFSFCMVERRNGNSYEHTDCYPKKFSKCEV